MHELLNEAEELLPVVGDDVHPRLDLLLDGRVAGRQEEGGGLRHQAVLFFPGADVTEELRLLILPLNRKEYVFKLDL